MTPEKKSALIFPAFINEYPENPFDTDRDFAGHFHDLLLKASELVDTGLAEFDIVSNPFLDDELRTQYITYIFSCAAGDHISMRSGCFDFTAGYSMGLYAAMVYAGCITFEDGLQMVRKAFELITNCLGDEKFGMCSVIGLSHEDIDQIIDISRLNIRVVNRNNRVAYVLSGHVDAISTFCKKAIEEGALNVAFLNATIPYHSDFLTCTGQGFTEFLSSIRMKKPETPLISLINQGILTDETGIGNEIADNLYTPLNWYKTQTSLMAMGVNRFVECGPGKSLVKNAKFIEGDYQFLSLSGFFRSLDRKQM